MEANNIPYQDLDVTRDKAARDELIKMGQMSVPVIDIDGEIILGYNEPKLKEKLGLS